MRALFVTAVGLWAGATVFFSAVVLPSLFLRLETAAAGQTAALLFPGYYAFGLITACAAALAAGYHALAAGGRAWRVVLFALVVALGCQAYAEFGIRPQMSALRGRPDGVSEFQRLHRLSVRLNAFVLLVSLTSLAGAAGLTRKP